jgi:hypothetical protein
LKWTPVRCMSFDETESRRAECGRSSDEIRALNNKTVKVLGFMMPLEPGDKQRHFLLSAVPTTCAFCLPGRARGPGRGQGADPGALQHRPGRGRRTTRRARRGSLWLVLSHQRCQPSQVDCAACCMPSTTDVLRPRLSSLQLTLWLLGLGMVLVQILGLAHGIGHAGIAGHPGHAIEQSETGEQAHGEWERLFGAHSDSNSCRLYDNASLSVTGLWAVALLPCLPAATEAPTFAPALHARVAPRLFDARAPPHG